MYNLRRSTALAFDVYQWRSAARFRPRGWVDHPSEGILTLYGITYQTLAEALADRDSTLAARAAHLADSMFANTSIAKERN
jgi:predicted component of type VI protein secretion system